MPCEAAGALLLIALCVDSGMTVPACAATYHLSPDGRDDAPGSRDRPWRTLEHASAQAMPGDTIVLGPGVYAGQLRPVRSGEVDAPITFRAQARRGAVLTGSAAGEYAAVLEGLSEIRLEGLAVRTSDPQGRWVRVSGCSRIVLDDIRMEDTGSSLGLWVTDSEDLTIRACELRLARAGSMARIEGSRRVLIEGCAFSRGGHDILLLQPDRSNSEFVLRGNVFHPGTCRGVLVDSVDRVLFEDNVVTRIFDGGRCANSNMQFFSSNSIFRFNRLFDTWGVYLLSLSTYRETLDFRGVRVYHNVFDDNSAIAVRALRTGRFGTASNSLFANNVFSRNDPWVSGRDVQITEDARGQADFAGNLFAGPVDVEQRLLTIEEAQGLAADDPAAGIFTGNIAAHPAFADPDAHNHAPAPGSPMIDGGAVLSHAVGDGSGSRLPVDDAHWFYDGYGIAAERGDLIVVGDWRREAIGVRVDLSESALELDRQISWRDGDRVWRGYGGAAPDLGGYQAGPSARPTVQIVAHAGSLRPDQPVRLEAVVRGNAQPASALWHFGDGSTATGFLVEHRFAEALDYPVRVEVTTRDGARLWGTDCLVVESEADDAAPLLHSTFGAEDEDWCIRWQCYRPAPAAHEIVPDGVSGGRSLHVHAPEDGGTLVAWTHPREWEIDRYPRVWMRYRIRPGTTLGVALEAFEPNIEERPVYLALTDLQQEVPQLPAGVQQLVADGQWHEISFDVRVMRSVYGDGLRVLKSLKVQAPERLRTRAGDEYWLDEVRIGRSQE